jgi:hypothetical protein
VVECLPHKCEVLSSITGITTRKKRKEEKRKRKKERKTET